LWTGSGIDEKLLDQSDNNRVLLMIDPQFFRPGEVPYLRGSGKAAREVLGFTPKYLWPALMADMVEYDLELAEIEAELVKKHRSRL
jgi:GDPmannose 4,6-dehydratase